MSSNWIDVHNFMLPEEQFLFRDEAIYIKGMRKPISLIPYEIIHFLTVL